MSRFAPVPGVAGLAGPLAVMVLLLCPGSAPTGDVAQAPVAETGTPAADPAALRLLEGAATAPLHAHYVGVQFVSAWTSRGATSLVLHVEHEPGVGTQVRSARTASGDGVDTFVAAGGAQPSLMGDNATLQLLSRNYAVAVSGSGDVAGRLSDIVEVRYAPSGRVAARFWLDRATGLVLRREVYDERGRTTRASAFIQIETSKWSPMLSTAGLRPPAYDAVARTEAWPEAIGTAGLSTMRARGWNCPAKLPGSLRLVDARRGQTASGGVVHLSYSDGLASLSVFEQAGRLDVDRLGGYRRVQVDGRDVYRQEGVPVRYVWSAHGRVFTVVADAPPRTVESAVAALPHGGDDGAWNRLGRGMDRVGSWFNPFG